MLYTYTNVTYVTLGPESTTSGLTIAKEEYGG